MAKMNMTETKTDFHRFRTPVGLLIRYPGGEDGLLWAHELRSWLVALGIPLQDQELVAGSHQGDRIELELITR